jgi:wyosine [tRNA(Phe)-imidazoG37] synthetase (radical SAM superfamily)
VDLIRTIHPSTAWISIPIRPPAESAVQPADMQTVNRLWKLLMDHNINAELLTGLEPAETGYTGNAENDILNITAVHPLREESMQLLLKNDHADDSAIESLLRKNLIEKVSYNSTVFYLRRYSV